MKRITFILIMMLMVFSPVGTALANSTYYQVVGNSMNPELQEGDFIEIVSEDYQDGDMVVAMKKDGTKIVKRLIGDRLVSVGDGTSYSVDEVTILGAARYTPMSLEEIEEYGFRWEMVLGEDEYIVKIVGGPGSGHNLALTNKGVVYAWGNNSNGQLGNNSNQNSPVPVKVQDGEMGNTGITSIAVGVNHSLALKNGAVYTWGYNYYGQLGDNSNQNSPVPVKVADGEMGNADVTAIAAGDNHTLALKNGAVYAWGDNIHGQLGDITLTASRNAPVKVADGEMVNADVTAIVAGSHHSLALKNGAVYGWGHNG